MDWKDHSNRCARDPIFEKKSEKQKLKKPKTVKKLKEEVEEEW